jgi:hypothetical protein
MALMRFVGCGERSAALMRNKKFAPAICLIGCFTIQPGAHAENIAANSAPPRVFVDAGACPFECCTYRQWTAGSAITVWDQPNGKRVVASLQKGDIVEGITGEVRSTPHPMKSDRDIPETEIKAGDVFYVLHYEGEGYWRIWFRGKLTQVHESVVRIHSPKAVWWVKIKDAHGNIGWTVSHGNFQHQDACE